MSVQCPLTPYMPQTTLRDNPRGKAHAQHHTAQALPKSPAPSPVAESGFCIPEPEQKFPTLPLALPDRCPKPDEQGLTETVELYKSEHGREITREEADIILSRTIRFVWAINLHRYESLATDRSHKQH